MLPNWLYGKSKSKLAELLGGGGGTPSDYDQVKAQVAQNKEDITQNAEDIALLSDALDDKAALTQITNPNILHNPWFQVNQRGATSTSSNGYFVDRWGTYCAATGTAYTLNSDGTITIDNSLGETAAYFEQRRTAKTISRISGRTITASVMFSDGSVRSGSETYISTADAIYYDDDDIQIQSQAQSYGKFFVLVVKPGKTITIKAVKLELGSVSTLAMDTAPDMATELAKCQRYFQRYARKSGQSAAYLGMFYQDSSNGNVVIDLPANMRTNPTITLASVLNVEVASGSKEISAIGSVTPNEACNKLKLTSLTMDSQTAGTVGIVTLTGSNYIDFSAEL